MVPVESMCFQKKSKILGKMKSKKILKVVQRMDHSASARIQKAREIIRRDLDDMKLPASSINAPQVDSERCALSFAPENEDPEKINNAGRGGWRKSAVR
jgi:hypothetical protein